MVFLLRRCGQHTLFSFSWPGARPNSTVWNGLYYTIREPPFTTAELIDMDYKVDFSTVTTQYDRVAVIATKPLTKNELWVEMKKGELLMFSKGLPYHEAKQCEIKEKEGKDLITKKYLSTSRPVGIASIPLDSIFMPDNMSSFKTSTKNG